MSDRPTTSMFISYRRADSKQITERIHERLADVFGRDVVFIDIEDIAPGQDFPSRIEQTLGKCNVVLVIIGKQWLTVADSDGKSRLHDPGDFVRQEIEWAGRNDASIVPVLVDGAQMPTDSDLPSSIEFITRRNALEIRSGTDFSYTMSRLVEHLTSAYELKRKDQPVRWEIALLIAGIIVSMIGFPTSVVGLISPQSGSLVWDAKDAFWSYARWELFGPFLLGLGPLVIGISRWICCLRRAQERSGFANAIFASKRKSPKSMLGFVLGLSSFGWGIASAIPAIVLCFLGWKQIAAKPAEFRGKRYLWIGLACACLGASVSLAGQIFVFGQYRTFLKMDDAQRQIDGGNILEAESTIEQVFDELPYHTRPYYLAGQLYSRQNRYEDTIDVLSVAIDDLTQFTTPMRKDDVLPECLRLIATAYENIGDLEQSKAALDQVEQLERSALGRAGRVK